MTTLLIGHWAGDHAHAVGLAAALGRAQSIEIESEVSPAPQVLGRQPLILVWSAEAAAAGAGAVFAAIGRRHPAAVVLARMDHAELPAELEALTLSEFDGDAEGRKLAREAKHALADAAKHARAPMGGATIAAAAQRNEGGFASGFSQGFAGSLAVLGLGGAMAVGASDRGPAVLGNVADGATNLFTTATAHASMLGENGPTANYSDADRNGALLSEWGMRRHAAAMRDDGRAEIADASQRLAAVEALMAERRAQTDAVIARLQQLSERSGRTAARTAQIASALPPMRVASAELPAPPVAVRSAARAAAPTATVQQVVARAEPRAFVPAAPMRVETLRAEPLAIDANLQVIDSFDDGASELWQHETQVRALFTDESDLT